MNSLGIDVSRYNGEVDWGVARSHGVVFAGIRACISWGYQDGWFKRNWAEAKAAGMLRLAYAVLYPGEAVGRQVDNFLKTVGGDWDGGARPVLDLELDHGQTAGRITSASIEWLETVRSRTGLAPIIYSRATWINEHTVTGEWRGQYDWWLAQYLLERTQERPAPPVLPKGVKSWLIHQNCDKFAAWEGLQKGGIETVDLNRWNGEAPNLYPFSEGKGEFEVWAEAVDVWARTLGYSGPKPAALEVGA